MTSAPTTVPTDDLVMAALATVDDPEIRRPITELDMVRSLRIEPDGGVAVEVLLTVAGCPMRDEITRRVTGAVSQVPGVTSVAVELGVMTDDQRRAMTSRLRGGQPEKEIPFAKPGSLTKVFAVASGKGGVG